MQKLPLLILIIAAVSFSVYPQPYKGSFSPAGEKKPVISGIVHDENGIAVPYASVALYGYSDNSLITGVATDNEGKFELQAEPGKYHLKISFLSYEEKKIEISLTEKGLNLGVIILKPGSIALQEVSVIAEKSSMELMLDKRVFNVGKDLANTGSNAAEILDQVPSVSVDIDGNVSLRGSENVRILIDGKPSGLTGISSTDALRQLQGNLVESIEVITNPSARYDAEGEAGIINIILRKEKGKGMNGSFDFTAGYPHNQSLALNLNFRKKWINLFSSCGILYRNSPGRGFLTQKYTGDTSYVYDLEREYRRGGLSGNFRLGTDIFINSFNTLTVSGLYKKEDGFSNATLIYRDYDGNGNLFRTVKRLQEESENQEDAEFMLNYTKSYELEGRKWSTDFQYINSNEVEDADLEETEDDTQVPLKQNALNSEDETEYLLQSDYIHPFGKKGKFESGLKAGLRSIEDSYTVTEEDEAGNWNILDDYNNHFVYDENIYAAYAIIGNKYKKYSWQAGIRTEYSDITTDLIETSQLNHREYIDYFPSIHLTCELDSTNSIQASYSRRLNRPRFRDLMPYFSFSDNRTYRSGNPNLDPEYTDSYEAGYLKDMDGGEILSSVYYRHRTGVIERITIADSTGFTRMFPVNLSIQNAFGIEVNGSYEFFKWWEMNGNFNFYRAITTGKYEGEELSSDTWSWMARGSSKMTIMKKLDFQLSGNYRAPQNTTQGKMLSDYWLDAGLSKDIFKGNGRLTLSVKDLFNTHKRRIIIDQENFYSEFEFQWHARQIVLSLNYRLNQKKGAKPAQVIFEGDEGF